MPDMPELSSRSCFLELSSTLRTLFISSFNFLKKFILKCVLFFLLLLGISFILDYMIQEGLKTSNYREVTKWNEVIQGGIDAKILIVGSSRALVHFDCDYIQKVTGKTCYNLGFDGTTYPLQKLMLELYLNKNQKPEKIIWSVDYHSFSYAPDFYGFEQLVPYRDNTYIRKMLSMHETPDYQFHIPLFRYSYNPKMKVIGLYSFLGIYQKDPVLTNGYRKQDKVWDGTFDEFRRSNPQGYYINIDQGVFNDFLAFNKILHQESVITWVISPYFKEYQEMILNRSEIGNRFEKAANQLRIHLMDYSNDPLSQDKSNFYNSNHLNNQGIEQFMNVWLLGKSWTN